MLNKSGNLSQSCILGGSSATPDVLFNDWSQSKGFQEVEIKRKCEIGARQAYYRRLSLAINPRGAQSDMWEDVQLTGFRTNLLALCKTQLSFFFTVLFFISLIF